MTKTFTSYMDKNGNVYTKFQLYSMFIAMYEDQTLEDFDKKLKNMLNRDILKEVEL